MSIARGQNPLRWADEGLNMPIVDFVEQKIRVAQALNGGECGGSYAEACIIVSAVLSGIASDLWPGEGLDRRRFVELWARYADPGMSPNLVSVPLLIRWLREQGRSSEAQSIEAARPHTFGPGYSDRVLTEADVDMAETEVASLCSSLTLAEIRRNSYGAVFYGHVRSALVHEYHFRDSAAGWPMTERAAWVSYVNRLDPGFGSLRQIHYHMEPLAELVRSVAFNVAPVVDKRPLPEPAQWWVFGG
jgi:hypothetical protein